MLRETIEVPADELERINTLLEKGQSFYDWDSLDDQLEATLRDIEDGKLVPIEVDERTVEVLEATFDDGLIGDVRVRGGRGPYVTFSLFEETDEGLQAVATHGSVREQLDTEWELKYDGTTYHLSVEPKEA